MSRKPLETTELPRKRGRHPRWRVRIVREDTCVFDSRSVSVRIPDRQAAAQLGDLVTKAVEMGLDVRTFPNAVWDGDLDDDCSATIHGFRAHAEHLEGPKDGGTWYCSVGDIFHTADVGFSPKNGRAARWLCEVAASIG